MSREQALVQVQNLTTRIKTSRGVVPVVEQVNFTIRRGEILALVGESGSGKSMTVNSMLKMIPKSLLDSYEGKIFMDGTDVLSLNESEMKKIRGNKVSMVFQNALTALDPSYVVGAQISEIIVSKTNQSRKEARNRVMELLQQVGIPDAARVYGSYPHQLSGGLRQRAVIAMALACEPDLIIADEPTTALDPTVQLQVLDLFKSINQQFGTAILMITHDFGIVAHLAHRVAVMYGGQIVEQGEARQMLFNPQHPYTQNLLACIPDLQWIFNHESKRKLVQIPGEPPNLADFTKGCRFADRCPEAAPACKQNNPKIKMFKSEQHWVRCINREGA